MRVGLSIRATDCLFGVHTHGVLPRFRSVVENRDHKPTGHHRGSARVSTVRTSRGNRMDDAVSGPPEKESLFSFMTTHVILSPWSVTYFNPGSAQYDHRALGLSFQGREEL